MGDGHPVRVMAAINASPESFYKGSVVKTRVEASSRIEAAISGGADIIDIGGMSTSPYLGGDISEEVEMVRVREALRTAVRLSGGMPVSVDTLRASVADMALRLGATIVNDVSGLKHDPMMARVVRDRGASLIAMAYSKKRSTLGPVPRVRRAITETLRLAEESGIETDRVVVDPGIGFFREEGRGSAYSPQSSMPWYQWDLEILAKLRELATLKRPICVGLSRKSFIGKVLGLDRPEERLPGSLAATAISVMNGAAVVRTHDVKETAQAVRIAEAVTRRA